jgi:hypothetical protein
MARPKREESQATCVNWYTYRGSAPIYGTDVYNALERTWDGTITPDYFAKKRKKEFIPPLAYQSNVIRRNVPPVYTWDVHHDYPYGTSEHMALSLLHVGAREPPLSYFGSSPTDEAKNKMLRRLSSKLQGVQANLGLMFVERRQTAEMIASTAYRVANAAISLKRGNLKEFATSLNLGVREQTAVSRGWRKVMDTPVDKRLANHWLEYVFGWLPLLHDIRDGAELLAESVATYKEPKGSVYAVGRTTASYAYRDPHSGLGHHYADIDARASITARCKAIYSLDDEARSVLSKTGISNPASLAWEALPFSFVVDWFLPVGNYLDSLTAFDGFSLAGVVASTLENAVASWRYGVYNQPGYVWSTSYTTGAKAEATQTRYIRTLSLPSYTFPSLRSPIGPEPLQRFTTAASLLLQTLRGDKPSEYKRSPREFLVNMAWSAPSRRGHG